MTIIYILLYLHYSIYIINYSHHAVHYKPMTYLFHCHYVISLLFIQNGTFQLAHFTNSSSQEFCTVGKKTEALKCANHA